MRRNVDSPLLSLVLITLLICIFAQMGFSQNATAALVGVVLDGQGLPIPGARVVATSSETGLTRTGSASREGAYALGYLPPGRYSVNVTAAGFRTFNQKEVLLEAAEVLRSFLVLYVVILFYLAH